MPAASSAPAEGNKKPSENFVTNKKDTLKLIEQAAQKAEQKQKPNQEKLTILKDKISVKQQEKKDRKKNRRAQWVRNLLCNEALSVFYINIHIHSKTAAFFTQTEGKC